MIRPGFTGQATSTRGIFKCGAAKTLTCVRKPKPPSGKVRHLVRHLPETDCRANFFYNHYYGWGILWYRNPGYCPAEGRREGLLILAGWGASTQHNLDTRVFVHLFQRLRLSTGIWPLRSPDISPPNYFLWGHLKNCIFSVDSVEELKNRITVEIGIIMIEMLQNVFRNFQKRIALCNGQHGPHFQQFL